MDLHDSATHPANSVNPVKEISQQGRFPRPDISRYNASHLLSGRQHFQTPRFPGNSIVHTSWCKES